MCSKSSVSSSYLLAEFAPVGARFEPRTSKLGESDQLRGTCSGCRRCNRLFCVMVADLQPLRRDAACCHLGNFATYDGYRQIVCQGPSRGYKTKNCDTVRD